MENDPNKKESKGKRILKKALRRNSKSSSNNSQNDRRTEERRGSPAEAPGPGQPAPAAPALLDIQEENNLTQDEEPTTSRILKTKFKVPTKSNETSRSQASTSKKNLKRKVEEEELAGASGGSAGTGSDNDADDKEPGKDKKKKNRCAVCRKKVGLTGFECRCGGLFCAVHRYSDKHDCSFDYRELGAQEIRRNNPVVVSQKIHKI